MKNKQLRLDLYKGKHGGRRPGAGRKRIHSKGVAHRIREKVTPRTPVHINFKFRTTVRNKQNLKLLKKALINARSHGLKILHFSLQSNHVHLIIEATDNLLLTKGMRSLTVTFAKGLKRGKVQVERYHLHVLKTVRETKNAILYVLFNKQKHEKGTYSLIDEYSSILQLSCSLLLIQKFAKKMKMTLTLGKKYDCLLDKETSYLMKFAIHELQHSSHSTRSEESRGI